jgi:hypothetical protein
MIITVMTKCMQTKLSQVCTVGDTPITELVLATPYIQKLHSSVPTDAVLVL